MQSVSKKVTLSKLRRHIFIVSLLSFLFVAEWLSSSFPRAFARFTATSSPEALWIQWGLVGVVAIAFMASMSWLVAPLIIRYVEARQRARDTQGPPPSE